MEVRTPLSQPITGTCNWTLSAVHLFPKEREAFSPLAATAAGNWSALGSNVAGTDGAISNIAPLPLRWMLLQFRELMCMLEGVFRMQAAIQLPITLPNGMAQELVRHR